MCSVRLPEQTEDDDFGEADGAESDDDEPFWEDAVGACWDKIESTWNLRPRSCWGWLGLFGECDDNVSVSQSISQHHYLPIGSWLFIYFATRRTDRRVVLHCDASVRADAAIRGLSHLQSMPQEIQAG